MRNQALDLTESQFQPLVHELADRMQVRGVAERVARQEERFEQIDRRFEQIDKRLEELIHYMDKRFEDLIHYVDKRFESVEKRLSFQQWLIGAGFLVLTALMTVYQFLA